MVHTYTHAHTLYSSGELEGLSVLMCNIGQKPPGSYIKFSAGHKVGPAMTLGGRVPNDIYQLGLNSAVVSTEDRSFWSICWAGGAHGSGWETCWPDLWWTLVNCNWLHVLSFQFFGHFIKQVFPFFSLPYILLHIAQRWSGSRGFSFQTTNLEGAGSRNTLCPHSISVRKTHIRTYA